MKRILSIALATILSIGALSSCGSSSSDTATTDSNSSTESEKTASGDTKSDEKVKLVIWGGVPEEAGPKEVCDNYNALNPNVEVEYVRYVNDDQGNVKLDTALISGEQIDIFISYGADKREKRVTNGLAADLTELCKEYDVDVLRDFGDAAKNHITPDGKIFAIPTYKANGFIMLNKNMFDAAGIEIPEEWTWEELRETAKKLTTGQGAEKVYGYLKSTDGNTVSDLVSIKNNRDSWINEDGLTTNFATNEDIKYAYELYNEMMYTDQSMMSWEDMIVQQVSANESPLFFGGSTAMVCTGSHMIRNIKNTEQFPRDFVTTFAEMPSLTADQEKYYANVSTQDDLSINVKSEHKEEAMAFIKWYYTEGYDPMIKGGRMPLYKGYDKDKAVELMITGYEDVIDVEAFKNVMFKDYEYMQYDVNNTGKAEIAKIMREEMEGYFLKESDIDTALQNMQDRSDEVLKSAK